ncbi:MAG: HAD family hydrolase [Candidatus Eremiobacteraeota bacterium]|nr:HAD family hydrolase [Candidatus Eremiobacteraeota bacterium]MCW5867157.1 HAD family hydrolase [Candidatus Eremiobacteraeota bacterium]
MTSTIRGVIFDVDGTLVDSNGPHAQAWLKALEEFGQTADAEEIRRSIGMGGDKIIPMQTPWSEHEPEGKALAKRRGEIFEERYLPTLNAFRGARELVRKLHEQGLKLAVASSAPPKELDPLLDIVGIRPYLSEKTSSGDAQESKPDPDIVAVALQRLELKADEVIMVGDTPYDLSAARKLTIRPLAFLTGGWSRQELGEAEWIFEGPAELLEVMGNHALEAVLA